MKQETRKLTYFDLDVWKVSHEFVLKIYRITKNFPKEEMYGLTSQIRRASASIPANISEGNGKQYLRGYIQSLYISKASLNEVGYFLLLSKDLEYLDVNNYEDLRKLLDRISYMLMALIFSLKKKDPTRNNY
jgi:four helix bundle protein